MRLHVVESSKNYKTILKALKLVSHFDVMYENIHLMGKYSVRAHRRHRNKSKKQCLIVTNVNNDTTPYNA